jgi:hypothetical protein
MIISQAFPAKAAVLILKTALALSITLMASGFVFYYAGNAAFAATLHKAAIKTVLFAPPAVISVLSVIFILKKQLLMALMGVTLLLLLLSGILMKASGS